MGLGNILKSIFGGGEAKFNIVEADRGNLPMLTLREIQQRSVDGLVVRNFISADECSDLVRKLKAENPNFGSERHPIYPTTFAQIDRHATDFPAEIKACCLESAAFVDGFATRFGFDLLQVLQNVFKQLNPDGEVRIAEGYEGAGIYNPGTFRIQVPQKVNINLHCGNQFIHLFPKFYTHLSSTVNVMDQLSYFIMLQEPEGGGRLLLYDISWDEAQECDTPSNSITTLSGKTIPLDTSNEIKSTKLEIMTGDLLIFSGGQIWHAVEQVTGSTDRVTFGGFLAFGKNEQSSDVYWWS